MIDVWKKYTIINYYWLATLVLVVGLGLFLGHFGGTCFMDKNGEDEFFLTSQRIDPPLLFQRQHLVRTLSDATERSQGKSHATLSIQKGVQETTAIFFASLVPQPNGAAFASVILPLEPSLCDTIQLNLKNLSVDQVHYQVLIETEYSNDKGYSYISSSTLMAQEQHEITLLRDQFKPSYRGRERMPDFVRQIGPKEPIVSVGLRLVGRSHQGLQKGVYAIKIHSVLCQ